MTVRDRLHRLVDALPEPHAEALARVVDAMAAGVLDPAARAALLAPDDDEPLTADDRAALAARAHADPAAYVPLDVALAQLDAPRGQ